jgi:thiamine-phosphate pyrophosphorylase
MINLRLYGLIDPDHTDPSRFFTYAQDLVKGGVTLIQYRDKKGSTRERIARARLLKEALHNSEVPLIINDRTDICLAAQAHGVHLGQDDMDPQDARALLGPHAFIGLTITQKNHLKNSSFSALSYISIGAVFPTPSKANPTSVGLIGLKDLLVCIREKVPHLPVCAIAGINEQTLKEVCDTGVDGVAVLSALSSSPHTVETARTLRNLVDQSLPVENLYVSTFL